MPDETITIRPATVSDAAAIANIIREIEWLSHFKKEPFADTEARVTKRIELCLADRSHTFLVAQLTDSGDEAQTRGLNPLSEQEVAGYISIHWLPYAVLMGLEGYISELFIGESHRSKGIGGMLLDKAKELGKQKGCSRLSLLNGRNRPAYERGFYRKRGWDERVEIANFIFPLSDRFP